MPRVPVSRVPLVLMIALLGGGLPPLALAEVPTPDTPLLAAPLELLHAGADAAGPDQKPIAYLNALGAVYQFRQQTLGAIRSKHGLTSLSGVATQDALDHEVVMALAAVTRRALDADTVAPSLEDARHLAEAMAGTPKLGDHPLAYMVVGFTGLTLSATDSLIKAHVVTRDAGARLALRTVAYGAHLYEKEVLDDLGVGAGESFMGGIVARLRCPQDGSPYQTKGIRSQLSGGNMLSRVYELTCPQDGLSLEVEFPLAAASKMLQMTATQKGKQGFMQPPRPPGPKP